MMAVSSESGSILFGRGPDGELHHIEDVERGEACNCVCPDPNCGQTLIARKGDKKAHHFAHKRGTCEWATEYVISAVSENVVKSAGAMVFPRLTYRNAFTGSDDELSQSRRMRVMSASLVEESGRGNPDLLVTCSDKSGATREFLVVLCLVHGLSKKSREAIKEAKRDAFAVDLRLLLKLRKEELGKHFDRERILLGFQDPDYLSSVLTEGRGRCMRWIFNSKSAAAEEESREKHEAWLEKERARQEKAAEERRKKAEEDAKRRRAALKARRAQIGARSGKRTDRPLPTTNAAKHEAETQTSMPLWSDSIPEDEYARMKSLVGNPHQPAIDSSGKRWYKCEICGKVSVEDDFPSIRGWVKDVNLGICRNCM